MFVARKLTIALLMFTVTACLSACNGRSLLNIARFNIPAVYESPSLAESQKDVFNSTWNKINENDFLKESSGIDWNQVNPLYSSKLSSELSQAEFHQLLEEMLAEIPNHKVQLISREERIEQFVNHSQGFNSIGPFVAIRDGADEEPRLIVLHVIPGSPAAEAGLRPHDAILSINGEMIAVDEGEAALQRLRSSKEKELQLIVRSPQQEPRIINITGRNIQSKAGELQSSTLPGTNILYIKFPPHEDRNILNEFAALFDQIQRSEDPTQGLILDMRLMTGAQRSAIFQLLPLFVDGDVAARTNHTSAKSVTIEGVASPLQNASQIPMILIVSRETSGPAEFFAAALQDQGRALIIGQNTAGTLQEVEAHFLPNGSELILPTSTLITANNQRDIGRLGIKPDILIDASWDEFTSANDPAIDQAVQAIEAASQDD